MSSIIMFCNTFNTLFNDIVRNVDPFLKGMIAISLYTIAVYIFAKSIIKKDSIGPGFKIGYVLISIFCLAIAIVYTVY